MFIRDIDINDDHISARLPPVTTMLVADRTQSSFDVVHILLRLCGVISMRRSVHEISMAAVKNRGPWVRLQNILRFIYHKIILSFRPEFTVRSTYDSNLRRAKISLGITCFNS